MSENPNPITIDNSVLILIDHQPWVAFSVQSIDSTFLVNNVAALATAAKAVGVPTVLTTVGASGGPLNDPPFSQISDVFPDQEPIDRVRRWLRLAEASRDTTTACPIHAPNVPKRPREATPSHIL